MSPSFAVSDEAPQTEVYLPRREGCRSLRISCGSSKRTGSDSERNAKPSGPSLLRAAVVGVANGRGEEVDEEVVVAGGRVDRVAEDLLGVGVVQAGSAGAVVSAA